MASLKTNIILVATVLVVGVLPVTASASGNEKPAANHLYQEGFGNVDKSAPTKKANLKDDFSKFRAEGTYSRSRSLGLGFGDGGSYSGGYSAPDAAPRGQRLGASSSYGSQPRGRSRCRRR